MSNASSDVIPQWGTYMREIYLNGKGPEPLGTVVFEEIEKKAIEKLKDLPGKISQLSSFFLPCSHIRTQERSFIPEEVREHGQPILETLSR